MLIYKHFVVSRLEMGSLSSLYTRGLKPPKKILLTSMLSINEG